MRAAIAITVLGICISMNAGAKQLDSPGSVTRVDCEKGQSLSDAVGKAIEGDTIEVTGYCNQEKIIIYVDRLKIRGSGGAVLDSPSNTVITVSAREVEIIDLELRRSFVVQEHGSAWLQGVTATNTTDNRPAIFAWYKGYIWVYQSQIVNNLGTAVRADANSVIDVEESTIANNDIGVSAATNSVIRLRDATLDNNVYGIHIGAQSSVQFRPNNTVSNNNIGMVCGQSGAYVAGSPQTFVGNTTHVQSDAGCHADLYYGVTIP